MDEAFHRLRNHARNHNLRLTELASHVVDGTQSIVQLDPLTRHVPARDPGSRPPADSTQP